MEKKQPITCKQAAMMLAKFILETNQICPIDYNLSIPECEGWKVDKERCAKCLIRHAEHLTTEF